MTAPSRIRSIRQMHHAAADAIIECEIVQSIISRMEKKPGKTVPINWIDKTEKYILVPRLERMRIVKKVKRLIKVKGACYFTLGVPVKLIDFIYRAVVKLGLRDRKLIFSRGSVKIRNRPSSSAVSIYELDWDLGTSFIIPQKRTYGSTVTVVVDKKRQTLRFMEIMVLSALLKLVHKDKSEKWRTAMAAAIIARGWAELEKKDPPPVHLAD